MTAFLHHLDGGSHTESSPWMLISMIAFSILLLWIGWSLFRRSTPQSPIAAQIATERFARGEIDADEFEAAIRGLKRE